MSEFMGKTYRPAAIEAAWYRRWEERGYFSPRGGGPPYCIMLPPPNVTGSLHMGHAFQHTLMDVLIRRRRMSGHRTLWQCGTDHAGIATQLVVENRLLAEGRPRAALGREAFVREAWRWKEESGMAITRQLRRLGTSMDWARERFTLDPALSLAVREVFLRLYREGLVYRGQRLVNWDPALGTAVSDLEVNSEEEDGYLWYMRYPLEGQTGRHLVVATTRPETLLGDVAVAVHPEDERYRALVGRYARLPLCDRRICVIADIDVDPAFGTGCVKITPAHDFNDYRIGRRHGLEAINVFCPDASLNDNAPPAYRGMDRYRARERIVADLKAQGLLEKVQKHRVTLPRGDRSGEVIEPYLTDQWFVRAPPLAEAAIRAVEDGRIRFVPENWAHVYYEWMRNIEDWCISRQLWWGHRIPAWYDEQGNVWVGHDEAEARAEAGLAAGVPLRQDPDVLDTWFSSALWPFSTLGWPEKTPELAAFYPTAVLVTGFDIIFFWVARMIMMGLKFAGDVPFREVYIHGLVRDAHGHKMSKSRGNVLDPLDLIDGIDLEALIAKRTAGLMRPSDAPAIERATRRGYPQGIAAYGTDSLRFTFASLATQGRDIRFDVGRIQGYRNFCNKLWNAARYVLMAQEASGDGEETSGEAQLGVSERWIRSRLGAAAGRVEEALSEYRFDLAAQAIYEFAWNEYCDWYLELSKIALAAPDESPQRKCGTRETLVIVLEGLTRLAHPLIPFITEELWQRLAARAGRNGETVMLQDCPHAEEFPADGQAEREIAWVQAFVTGVRRIRSENRVPPSRRLPVRRRGGSEEERRWLERHRAALMRLAGIEEIRGLDGADDQPAEAHATALAGGMTVLVPLAGSIDRSAELRRLHRDIERYRGQCRRVRDKLDNPSFLDRAPETVVARERRRFEDLSETLAKLETQQRHLAEADTDV